MLTDEKLKRLCAHDWRSTIQAGTDAAHEKLRKGSRVDGTHIAWELLRDAVSVSRIAYPLRHGQATHRSLRCQMALMRLQRGSWSARTSKVR